MREAILARHGESVFNVVDVLNGEIAVPGGLTARGVEQARALGRALRDQTLDLCVVSEFERAQLTADVALEGREVSRLVWPTLNDPLYGPFEGKLLEEYRAWAAANHSRAVPGERGESRYAIVARYAQAFRKLLARPEDVILVVCHSLPVSYALGGRDGIPPGARVPMAGNATPYPFTEDELERATVTLETWLDDPTW
jgi:2,3-bisphosphoglycerate-dependent phosphoglycerate mutase